MQEEFILLDTFCLSKYSAYHNYSETWKMIAMAADVSGINEECETIFVRPATKVMIQCLIPSSTTPAGFVFYEGYLKINPKINILFPFIEWNN